MSYRDQITIYLIGHTKSITHIHLKAAHSLIFSY